MSQVTRADMVLYLAKLGEKKAVFLGQDTVEAVKCESRGSYLRLPVCLTLLQLCKTKFYSMQ